MDLYLVRHAHAGSRGPGPHDKWRPLSEQGLQRAAELAGLLADVEVGAILSSPATRCVQTVDPLAERLGMEVVETDALWEGASIDEALELLDDHAATGAVISSHGDIIPHVIETLGRRGVPLTGRGCEKGSVWVLSHDGSGYSSARYVSNSSALA